MSGNPFPRLTPTCITTGWEWLLCDREGAVRYSVRRHRRGEGWRVTQLSLAAPVSDTGTVLAVRTTREAAFVFAERSFARHFPKARQKAP